MSHPLGELLRQRRKESGLAQREIGQYLGISHVFYGECERGMRFLPEKHWPSVCRRLGNLTLEDLAHAKRVTKPVAIDVSGHPPAVQAFVVDLQTALEHNDVSARLAARLHALLDAS